MLGMETTSTPDLTGQTIAHLCGRILRADGQARVCAARTLTQYAEIDLVAVLVGAAERHQAATAASSRVNRDLHNAIQAVRVAARANNVDERIEHILSSSIIYLRSVESVEQISQLRERLIEDTKNLMDAMADADGHSRVDELVFAAVTAVIAEVDEAKALQAFREIQTSIVDTWHGAPMVLPVMGT